MATGQRTRTRPTVNEYGPETCHIYLRISQDRTGEQAGVDRQLKECEALAAKLGLQVEKVWTDNDVSATSGKVRPQFEAMLDAHPEVIVSWHQDRLLRLISDLEKVIDLGVDVHFVAAGTLDLSTPAGRAVARTIAAWSQYETEQKGLRQKSSNRQRAEQGHWQFSRRPYGYRRTSQDGVSRIEVVEDEADVVRELFTRYNAGESSYALAQDLNDRGVPTITGTEWSMERVRQLLRNARYAGIVESNGVRYDVKPKWTPIIDERTWTDSLAVRDGRTRAGSWSSSVKHLASGLLVCGKDGTRMLARPDHGRLTYACRECWRSIPAADVDAFIEAVVLERLKDRKVLNRLRKTPDTQPLTEELDELRRRQSDLADLVADGLLDRRRARERGEELEDRIGRLQKRLDHLRRKSPLTDLALGGSIPKRWSKLGVMDRRRVVSDLGLVVSVGPGRKGRQPSGFSPVVRLSVDWT